MTKGFLFTDKRVLSGQFTRVEVTFVSQRAAQQIIGQLALIWLSRPAKQVQNNQSELSENESYIQLQMVWPGHLLNAPPAVRLAPGYALRTYLRGDEPRFYEIMELAGWPGWNDEKLQPWLERILPEGWFMAVDEERSEIVVTAMALGDCSGFGRPGGELGWVAGDPVHGGRGLGMAVCVAATERLIAEGYRQIHLYTEHWRLAALKIYLKLGYMPFLNTPEMTDRWQAICEQLQWPFTPEVWRA